MGLSDPEGRTLADAVFRGRHFAPKLILTYVRWYCRYGVSYRDLEQMMAERGAAVDHTTIYRWVQRYAPEMEKRLRWQWRSPRSTSWRVDETYIKVVGRWTYLYRAVDKHWYTIDFYLSPTRSAKAAKRFLGKALSGLRDWEKPHVINTDKAPRYGVAIAELKAEGKPPPDTEHRQAMRGFKSLRTAYATIKGFELMLALRKGQVAAYNLSRDVLGEARLIERAFGIGAGALAEVVALLRSRASATASLTAPEPISSRRRSP